MDSSEPIMALPVGSLLVVTNARCRVPIWPDVDPHDWRADPISHIVEPYNSTVLIMLGPGGRLRLNTTTYIDYVRVILPDGRVGRTDASRLSEVHA